MFDLLTRVRRAGRASVVMLCLAAVAIACVDEPDNPVPDVSDLSDLPADRPVVEYDSWPLGRLETAIAAPACSEVVPSRRHFRLLTPADAAAHGFGIAAAYVESARQGMDAPELCAFASDEPSIEAFSQALNIFLNEDEARQVYGEYGECMVREGVEGAADPEEAELLVSKRNASIVDSGTVVAESGPDGEVVSGRGTPTSEILKHSKELLEFDRRVATASVRCQAATIAPASERLIAVQQRVIDSAPAETKALLEP